MKIEIKHRFTGNVLYTCDAENMKEAVESAVKGAADLRAANLRAADLRAADLRAAILSGANLGDADLCDADLQSFKVDFFDILLRSVNEIGFLRDALINGKVDGSTYEGECACLVGTLAKARDVSYAALGNGLSPNASRPAEQWFMSIKKGDTPETNQASKITVEWVDEFLGLIEIAK